MAKKCVNINSNEFKQLIEDTNIPAIELAGIVSLIQESKDSDEFPSISEIELFQLEGLENINTSIESRNSNNIEDLMQKFYSIQSDNSSLSKNLISSNDKKEDTLEITSRKIELMQKALNAEVLIDSSIQDSGMLLPANHPLTLKHGKPVIVINPNKLFSDTVIHEFGHLYIDLLGSKDGVVNQAYELLRGTVFYNEIAEQYPELNPEDLDKEVLATAIGLEGDRIFKDSLAELSTWQKIKNYILSKMKDIFGLNQNAIEKLATEMLRNQTRLTGSEKFNTSILQKSKFKIDLESKNKQAEVLDLFDKLNKTFSKESIDGENHYKDKDRNIFNNSVTRDIKGYRKMYNNNHKGDFEIHFDKSLYSKENIMFQLESPKIPYALAKALNDFIKQDIISNEFILEESDKNNWLNAYLRDVSSRSEGTYFESIHFEYQLMKHFDLVMLRAEEHQSRLDQAPIVGNIVHNAIEMYVKEGISFPSNISDEESKLLNSIKSIVDNGRKKGSIFVTEQILFSENRGVPGTADLIEILKDGSVKIYDYKTLSSFKDKARVKSDSELYMKKGYIHQLASYGSILGQYGVELNKDPYHIVAIEVKYSGVTSENSPISIGEVRVKSLSDENTRSDLNSVKQIMYKRYATSEQLKEINIKSEIQNLADLSNKINNYINVYKKRTRNLSSELDDSSIKKIQNDLIKEKLESDLNTYIAKNNEVIIKSYVNNIHNALSILETQQDYLGSFVTPEYLQSLDYVLQVSDGLNDIKNLLKEQVDLNFEDKEELLKTIDNTLNIVENNKKYYKEKLKSLAVSSLAENSNLMQGLFAERFKIEARTKEGLKSREEISLYVEKKLRENKELIAIKERDFWTKQYSDGFGDLRYLEYLMADPGMSKSQMVQVVKNVLDKADNSIRNKMMDVMPDINKWYQDLKFDKTGDPKKVWADFLEKKRIKENGKTIEKLSGSVIPEFISDYRKTFLRYEAALNHEKNNLRILEGKIKKTQSDLDSIKAKKSEIDEIKKQMKEELIKRSKKEGFTTLRENPDFAKLSEDKKEALRFIHKSLLDSDERLSSNPEKRLVQILNDGSYVFNLPRERMSNIESFKSGELIKGFKSKFEDMIRPPADDTEFGIAQEEYINEENHVSNSLGIDGRESFEIPVFYRNKLEDESLQSYDIPTLLALNAETTITYQENKLAEADLFVIKESLSSSNNELIFKSDSFVNKKIQDATGKVFQKSDDNYVYQAVKSSIDNRLYKRAYRGVYSKANYRLIKGAEVVSKYASTLALSGNFMSALSTFSQGSIYRMIEANVGEHMNSEDWKVGTKKAWTDVNNMIKDTQRFVPEAKTNLLIRKFGLETQLKALTNKFVQDNFAGKNLDSATLFGVTSIAEAMVTSTLMYSLMNNIKVINDNGEYINSEGKVVKKSNAMSLDEAYEVKDGKLELNNNVKYTSFNITEKFNDGLNKDNTIAATEISRYIRSVYADLYGQYNQDMKSVFQRTIVGKLTMNLRGWLPRGMHKRWRGITTVFGDDALTFEELRKEENLEKRFYSQDQKQFQEGHYTTSLRFIKVLIKQMKRNQEGLTSNRNSIKNTMTEHELANLKRTQYELAVMLIMMASALLLRVIAENSEGDDEDKQKIYFAAYLSNRITNELATFIYPPSLMNMISNPAASMSTIQRVFGLLTQLTGFSYESEEGFDWNINDEYERGSKEGELKLLIKSLGLIPGTVKYQQMKSILGLESKNSIEDSFEYSIRENQN